MKTKISHFNFILDLIACSQTVSFAGKLIKITKFLGTDECVEMHTTFLSCFFFFFIFLFSYLSIYLSIYQHLVGGA